MNRPPVWVAELAARFWDAAGDPPPLPRDLAASLVWLPHLTVAELPGLTLSRAADYLARLDIPFTPPGPDRPLRGLLHARNGGGVILLHAEDDPAERRFTLAHEVAHFLRDYEDPRRRVLRRLGPDPLAVLDGVRQPTADERLRAVLRGVALGCHVHLLNRDESGRPASAGEREAAADRLAFELLAPFDAVEPIPEPDLIPALAGTFGLPAGPAVRYAGILLEPSVSPTFFPLSAENR